MKQITSKIKGAGAVIKSAFTLICMGFGSQAFAALPTVSNPTTTVQSGDFIGLIQAYAKDIGVVAGLVIGFLAMVIVAKNMIGVYNEIGAGKKTWGDMGIHGGMGVLLLVFVVYLLTEAAKIL